MKSVLALVCVLGLLHVAVSLSHVPSSHPAFHKFSDFMKTYNKQYDTPEEFQSRFKIFVQNLEKIDQLNAASKGAKYNVTQFSDMTREEFRKYPCGVEKLSTLTPRRPGFRHNYGDLKELTKNMPAAPPSWDWVAKGAVTPIKNQGQCGSCWAFSTIGNIEGVNFVTEGKLLSLSEQEEVDCSKTSYGCGGGWPFWAMSDILGPPANGGIDSESGYPYTAEDGTCAFSTSDQLTAITSYKSYCTEQTAACDETAMAQLLVNVGPLSACLDATSMQSYTSGVDNPTAADCDPSYIDHCITIVGYGNDPSSGLNFWRIKNSWGTGWGESGYYRLVRGTGACGINSVITVATV